MEMEMEAALEDDRDTTHEGGETVYVPLAASTIIYALSLVCLDANGRLVPGADTAGLVFAGVSLEQVDNSAGAAAAKSCEVRTTGVWHFTSSGLVAADVGKRLYLADDQTVVVGDGAVEAGVYVGTLAYFLSATVAPVRLDMGPGRRQERGTVQQFAVRAVGVNATDLDLAASAAKYGGSGIYVTDVVHLTSHNTTAGNSEALIVTTDYTVADGDVTLTADRSAAGTVITGTVIGRLKE